MASTMPPINPHESKSGRFIGLAAVSIVIATLCTGIRVWSKVVHRQQGFWWDDWLAMAAAVVSVVQSSLEIVVARMGFGRHAATIPVPQLLELSKIIWVNVMIWGASITIPKLSVILMYARVFHVGKLSTKIALWFVAALNVVLFLYIIFMDLFQCNPVKKAWEGPLVEGHCVSTYSYYLSTGIIDLIIDIYLLILPIPILWMTQMQFKRKVQVMLMFVLGYSIIAVTIGRLVALVRTNKDFALDPTWTTVTFDIWSVLEGPLLIFCITLPSIHNLTKRAWTHGFKALGNSRVYGGSGSGYAKGYGRQESYARLEGSTLSPDKGNMQSSATGASDFQDDIGLRDMLSSNEIRIHTKIDVDNTKMSA